jgi:hypothetical protein
MVVPPSVGGVCDCHTVTVKVPKPPDAQLAYTTIAAETGAWATMMYGMSVAGWPPWTAITTRAISRFLAAISVAAAALAEDPPDLVNAQVLPDVLTLLEPPVTSGGDVYGVQTLTTADGCTATQCANMNTIMNKLNQAQAKLRASQQALDRWAGCVQLNCAPAYLEQQLDYYDQVVVGFQTALSLLRNVTVTLNDSKIWKTGPRDYRPFYAPLYQGSAELLTWSTTNLQSQ